ncbi:MAG: tetratricopeptide repeat protein, partial [Candidatus Eremiobacteraeota bacterium]|nr:tetratricopeptide repeat protein [Candidatus Eremiobacteraeota bacterium]
LCFGTIQLASYGLDAGVAAPGTLPTHVSPAFGLAVYRVLDRIAPAPYVESTLAETALRDGDFAAAQRSALRLPSSAVRDELLARIAAAQGDATLALEYFIAAPDVDAVRARVDSLASSNPAAAYALERVLKVRLDMLATHPDAVAEASFRMGEIANVAGRRERSGAARTAWFRRGMTDFTAAVALAPWSDKYLIAAANQAILLGDLDGGATYFQRAADADPGSADARAGLGVVAFRRGDVERARRDLARARQLDPQSGMVGALSALLQGRSGE